jgi:septal ring factor EnvC (AmiA/AmiB activator)
VRPPANKLIAAALLLALVGRGEAADPPKPEARLKELESALQKGEQDQQEIKRRAKLAAEAAEKVRAEMVAAARGVQENEDGLSELESQMADLAGIERDKARALDLKRQQLNSVLTAVERLAFRPTEALIAQPTSPADTVRSAILLKDLVPRIEAQVAGLKADIESLASVKSDIAKQKQLIAAAAARLDSEHRRLATLYQKKQEAQVQTESEQASAEQRLKAMASEAEDLRDLMTRLEEERKRREQEALARAAAEKAAKEAEIAAQKAAREAEEQARRAAHEAEIAAKAAVKEKHEREVAELKKAKEAEIAAAKVAQEAEAKAQAAVRDAARAAERTAADQRQAAERANRPFSHAQGEMPFPARGRVVVRFGQTDESQSLSKGISIETRPDGQVIAPYNGQVVFAGPFRGYGLLLIIEHGEGYHTLLAGMARIDGTVGQHLTTGEPVGVMGQQGEGKPLLYVELRHNGQPVNPLPWLTARKAKVSG